MPLSGEIEEGKSGVVSREEEKVVGCTRMDVEWVSVSLDTRGNSCRDSGSSNKFAGNYVANLGIIPAFPSQAGVFFHSCALRALSTGDEIDCL
jgi:hypothetical protein